MAFARRTHVVFLRPLSESHFARAFALFAHSARAFLPFSFEHFASAVFSRCLLSHCAFFLPLSPEQAGFGLGGGGLVGGGGVGPGSFDDGPCPAGWSFPGGDPPPELPPVPP